VATAAAAAAASRPVCSPKLDGSNLKLWFGHQPKAVTAVPAAGACRRKVRLHSGCRKWHTAAHALSLFQDAAL
jgi:hypothetical protein